MLAAQVLAKAAARDGRNVLQTQAYGAEARGSLTKSEVIISGDRINFPAARKIDVLVAMSQEAANELVRDLKETGTLVLNSSSVKSVPQTKAKVRSFPITETARSRFGDDLYANMVMLGVLLQLAPLAGRESAEEAIRESTPKKAAETNVKALAEGMRLVGTE